MAIASVNPANGATLATFAALSATEIEHKLGRSYAAFKRLRRTSFEWRSERLLKAAEILEADARRWAELMTLEMGKTPASAEAEAKKCATACRYYAENGARHLADEVIQTSASKSLVRYQPLGPVLAIMPWNFPFWQVFRFAAPALMAGNTGLLKHASNVPQCALAIEEILRRAGFDNDEFQTLLVESDAISAILDDPRVAAATLTGSERAGQEVASRAGRAIKKTVLELGGSDPFVVIPPVDIDAVAKAAAAARCINNGQSCIAAKRFIVLETIYDEFERRFAEAMRSVDAGPLATRKIRDELHDQVTRAVSGRARLVTGGSVLDGPGNYFQPTILADVPPSCPVYYEELFGPVAMLFRARDVAHAIEIANDSRFGLGASVWTDDSKAAELCVNEIESGQVFVNAPVASDARVPFGGVKNSGYGRELGEFGIREFVNLKTVWWA